MIKKISIALILSVLPLFFAGCRIKKGMQALEIYNYFEAKSNFEKAKKRKIVPAAYGLSIIYERNDNPFYNIDSAYNNITLALDQYSLLDAKQKQKYAEIGVDSVQLIRQRNLISADMYKRATDFNSVIGYQDFIDRNPWSENLDSAIFFRDSLFFYQMDEGGTSNDYQQFLQAYPNSVYAPKAQHLYDKTFYIEQTKDEALISYVSFVSENTSSPFIDNAQNKIYQIETKTKTEEAYYYFIQTYTDNPNRNKAWKLLYETYLQNHYSKTAIADFIKLYPDYPFLLWAKNELKLEQIDLLDYQLNGNWGFVSLDGTTSIEPKYDFVGEFSEGLALVSQDQKIGYIAKTGEQKIDFKFDDGYAFHNGFAVVELNDKMGLINRVGEFIIEPEFTDLGNMNEGLCYFELDEKFGYFDSKGLVRLKPDYSDAADFVNHKAIVAKNDYYGVIDPFGTTYLPFVYDKIRQLNDTVFAVKQDQWGLMTTSKDTILPCDYSFISLVNHNLILVERDDEFNFWNLNLNAFISDQWFEVYAEYRIFAEFKNGYAKIKTEDGYNFIDTLGQFKFKNSFDNLGYYQKNIAFEKNEKWGYINQNNQILLKPTYEKTTSFDSIGGVVVIEPLKGMVGENQTLLLDVFYEDINIINDSMLVVKSRGRYGVMSTNKDTLLPFNYKYIEPFSDKVVKIVSADWVLYYNLVTNKWIRKEE
ncbi:MAG: WG repeat-containing protein [Putridiphycobacter sp.]